jgi:SAM-dependent methyltransferase
MGEVLSSFRFEPNLRVHEFSKHGAIFKYLSKRFPSLSNSEYYDGIPSGQFKEGVQCQDLQNLSFEDNQFDLMTSTEVFEHVPDDAKGYAEVLRCLKPNGYFIFTVPLNLGQANTQQRAKLENGELVHMLPPEYHGDHLRNKGILAFRNYGTDIKPLLESIGFAKVELRLIDKPALGISPAKYVIIAQK